MTQIEYYSTSQDKETTGLANTRADHADPPACTGDDLSSGYGSPCPIVAQW